MTNELPPLPWRHTWDRSKERGEFDLFTAEQMQEYARAAIAQAHKPLTDERIDAAVKAWFENPVVAGRRPFAKRMRAAIEAFYGNKGGEQ